MQTNPNVIVCPACGEPYGVTLETGMRFCPSCRHEWDPVALAEADAEAATRAEAEAEAAERAPLAVADGPTVDEIDEDAAAELVAFTAEIDGQAAAYLEALTGTMVTLEGGQRATIVSFTDDDSVIVQLASGDTVVVEFNDIIAAGGPPKEGAIVEVEIDDATAELLGDAVLTMACLAVEAGLASLTGDGDEYELVEPPSGWIPDDADAIPLMEQAAAVAVAMLVKTFGLPRDMIAVAVDKVRPATRKGDVTEEA